MHKIFIIFLSAYFFFIFYFPETQSDRARRIKFLFFIKKKIKNFVASIRRAPFCIYKKNFVLI